MNNPLVAIINLVEKLIDGADNKMLETIRDRNNNDIYFSAPDLILRLLESGMLLESEIDHNNLSIEKFKLLDNVNIIPSFEWSIILFHKDYPLYKHNWMVRKIALDVPLEIKAGDINKTIIYVNGVD